MRNIWVYFIIIIIFNLFKNLGQSKNDNYKRKRTASAPRNREARGDYKRLPKNGREILFTDKKPEEKNYSNVNSESPYFLSDYENPREYSETQDLIVSEDKVEFDMSDLQRAVIMSEILDKPLALRK